MYAPDAAAPVRGPRFVLHLLVCLLCLIGWGKMDIWLASWFHFSIGGSSSGVFRLLLAGYLGARLFTRDLAWRTDWLREPFVWLCLLAAVSPVWNLPDPSWPAKQHDTAQVVSLILPALTAYLAARYALDADFEGSALIVARTLAVAFTLVSAQILVSAPGVLFDFAQVDSLYEHHTHVAMRMVMAIPLTIGLMMYDRKPSTDGEGAVRPAYYALLLLQIVAITIANSRIGWMALGVVSLYGAFFGSSARMRRWFVVAVLLVLALAFSFPKVRGNFLTLLHLHREENYQRRIIIYRTDLDLIARNPWLGLGFSNRTFLYAGRAVAGETFDYEHPHDLFLQIPVYLGIPGALCLAALLVSLGLAVRTIGRRAPPEMAPLIAGVRGALLGLLVMNVAETALSSERLTFMIPVFFALVMSWARSVAASPAPPPTVAEPAADLVPVG